MPRLRASTYAYLLVAIAASAPAWIVKYPPLQDLPFHLATMRVIHSYSDPAYGFSQYFDLTILRTQYVLYYLVGSALAYVLGVAKANIVLMSVYLGGTPLAIRDLLNALRKDERLCLLSIPFLVNAMFMFGLLPFMFGIPIMFWGIATCVRYLETHRGEVPHRGRRQGVLLAILTFAAFYSHVFPFGIFALAYAVLFPWRRPSMWIRAMLPALPTLAFFALWLLTPSGKIVRGALNGDPNDVLLPLGQSLHDAHTWVCDVFRDSTDEAFFILTIAVALLSVGLAQGDKDRARPQARLLVILPLFCMAMFFTTGQSRGVVWLFAQRFPILFFFTLIPLLRVPTGWRGQVVTAAMAAVAAGSTLNVCRHFIAFQLDEVGDLDDALAHMKPAKKTAALIYDKSSRTTNWAPFLHFGSYYQLEKGGVVEFTYANFAHWPFAFKAGMEPPSGAPPRLRWEWTPEQVSTSELYPYYDYVLTRGQGFHPPPSTFRRAWHGDKWDVWERVP
jgi:hypothetical protein